MNSLKTLKYPPIKSSLQKKIPKHLIYQFFSGKGHYLLNDTFVLFDTKQDNKRCYMLCHSDWIDRIDKNKQVPSLYINKLKSNPIKNGLGTKMLDFAQIYSKRVDCNGYFHLSANSAYMPKAIPHIFYGKYGMNTESQEINNKIYGFIKKNKDATYRDLPNITMFYPPIDFTPWYEKIKNFFTSLIK